MEEKPTRAQDASDASQALFFPVVGWGLCVGY